MKRIWSLMIGVAGSSLVLSGCSAEALDVGGETTAERTEAACPSSNGTARMIAVLANAMAKELHRWELTKDFTKIYNQPTNQFVLALSSTGQDRCRQSGAGTCPMIRAVLSYQDARLDQVFRFADGTKLSPWSFAYVLTGGYETQKKWQSDCRNPGCSYEAHQLSFSSAGAGACRPFNTFSAEKEFGGPLDHPERLANALKFTEVDGSRNLELDFTWGATLMNFLSSPEFEAGGPFGCTEYSFSTAAEGALCTCAALPAGTTLQRVTTTPGTPNMLYCRKKYSSSTD